MKIIIGLLIILIIILTCIILNTSKKNINQKINNVISKLFPNLVKVEEFENKENDDLEMNYSPENNESNDKIFPSHLPNPDTPLNQIIGSPSPSEESDISDLEREFNNDLNIVENNIINKENIDNSEENIEQVSENDDLQKNEDELNQNNTNSKENEIMNKDDLLNKIDEDEEIDTSNTISDDIGESISPSDSIEDLLNQYMKKNKECNSKLINDKSYENKFTKSFKNYLAQHFKDKLGYIPEFTKIESLNKKEFSLYLDILSGLPVCSDLISNYSQEVTDYTRNSHLNSLDDSLTDNQNIKSENKPKTNSNMTSNDYVRNNPNQSFSKSDGYDYTDRLMQNQEIMKNMVKTSEEKLYTPSDNTENKMFDDKADTVDIGDEFNFKPNIHFNHNEPSKKIASAYGWSYMPPQTWSVPQKRPPVCIPDNDKQSTVKAIYDKGTPVDALDWVKSGAILPHTEYTEQYNENYYYPGWKAQEHIEYPFKGNNNQSNEYYNYNLAKSI